MKTRIMVVIGGSGIANDKPDPNDPKLVERGKVFYGEQCYVAPARASKANRIGGTGS
jgi:hypothetical protein